MFLFFFSRFYWVSILILAKNKCTILYDIFKSGRENIQFGSDDEDIPNTLPVRWQNQNMWPIRWQYQNMLPIRWQNQNMSPITAISVTRTELNGTQKITEKQSSSGGPKYLKEGLTINKNKFTSNSFFYLWSQ